MNPDSFRNWIASSLKNDKEATKMQSTSNPQYTVVFTLDMQEFLSFLEAEYPDAPVGSVLTVTGSIVEAFADRAVCYTKWQWQDFGWKILIWLSKLRNRKLNYLPVLRNATTTMEAWVNNESSVKILVSGTAGEIAVIALQLCWMTASFRRPLEHLSVSEAEAMHRGIQQIPTRLGEVENHSCFDIRLRSHKKMASSVASSVASCWKSTFRGFVVAYGFPTPPRPKGFSGIQLPFSLLQTLAEVDYPLQYRDTFVLKGKKSALLPVFSDESNAISSIQWHFIESQTDGDLTMNELDRAAGARKLLRNRESLVRSVRFVTGADRHFLGLYQRAGIHVGTRDSDVDNIRSTAQLPGVSIARGKPFTWLRMISPSISFPAPFISFGISTTFQLPRSSRMRLDHNRNLNQLIRQSCRNLALLYNVQTHTAWLLPEVCVILHMMKFYARENYLTIAFPTPAEMASANMEGTCRVFLQGTTDITDYFTQFAKAFDQMKQDLPVPHCRSRLFPSRNILTGVDFAELATLPDNYHCRWTNISKSHGGWLDMLKDNWLAPGESNNCKIVRIFCDHLGPQPISPEAGFCTTWERLPPGLDYLITTKYCLNQLTRIHGNDPVKLSPNHFWVPIPNHPYRICNGQHCNRLQNLVREPPECRWRDIFGHASNDAAMVFGGAFRENNIHMLCNWTM
ncbi:hypothetical protein BKA56DRAFT_596227 [Ilyonectria sp. MPI-CAGE-AT-0026]|nr:hypothetical protein BKA56DRAFT_596227 [Ilyonectria sp. MPI-CAGE-AT-0026]